MRGFSTERKNIFSKAIFKTRQKLMKFVEAVGGRSKLSFEDIEDMLISIDYPQEMTEEIVNYLKNNYVTGEESLSGLNEYFVKKLSDLKSYQIPEKFTVILVTGVNGSGKTTTVAKLAHFFEKLKKKVLLCAADTYRAAGSEQLEIWAERLNIPVVSQIKGAHPGAVIFDSIKKGIASKVDIVLADTAGRLHSRSNLMDELKKIKRSAEKAAEGYAVQSILTLDAFLGQNALRQVEEFNKALDLDYLAITKADGSAKGGAVLAAALKFKIPIAFIGYGENLNEIQLFESKEYIDELFCLESLR